MLGLIACTPGPDYRRSRAVVPAGHYLNAPGTVSETTIDGLSRWWERMDDAAMNRYVDLLLEQNLQLQEAGERVYQAWARLGIEKGGLWPSLSASGSAARRMQPVEQSGFSLPTSIPGIEPPPERVYTTQWQAALSTSWQIDLFGKVRRSVEAAEARIEASQTDVQALMHSLIGELARSRVALAIFERRLAVARETVESRRLTLEAIERRYRSGTGDAAAVDVHLARENLAAAQADAVSLRSQLTEEAYRLDVLLGRKPGSTDPTRIGLPLLTPPDLPPVGLPAQLLDRRPDLRSAELRLKAATADVGVAIADLYPNLTLSGTIGFQNDELQTLFSSQNLFGSIMGDLLVRLFEGGRLRANIELQKARVRELAAGYARQILNALREVETALSNARYTAIRMKHLKKQLTHIRSAEDLAWSNYRRGLRPLLDVLEVQRRRYLVEQSYLLAAQSAWNSRIALYLALGGDWLEAGEAS